MDNEQSLSQEAPSTDPEINREEKGSQTISEPDINQPGEGSPVNAEQAKWFAIKTRNDFKAEEFLKPLCEEVYFPKETVVGHNKKKRERAIIPRVLFIKTTEENAVRLERAGREHPEWSVPFWIYRYPHDNRIQVIPQSSMQLLRLLTVDDTTRCEIFTKKDFRENQHVRITGGIYKGYEGFVQRVKKNKHVVVKIEGVCLILLPFIHPDLLQPLD